MRDLRSPHRRHRPAQADQQWVLRLPAQIGSVMEPQFVVIGKLTREFYLPPAGEPRLDVAGGSLLYVAAGLGVWERGIGLVGRIGHDYPRAWLNEVKKRGF